VTADVARFERELLQNPQLVARILATLPPVPEEPGLVIVGASPERVDEAICRALALACQGVLARVELL
jgi:hypothetical protein